MATKMLRQMRPVAHHPAATRVTVAVNETAVVTSDWRGANDFEWEREPSGFTY